MLSLLPLITFIVIYLGVSIVMGDFYKVPITVAFLVSAIVAVMTFRGKTLTERLKVFSRNAASENMMLMIWIFILAGAFASSAKAMGSIDNTINMALAFLPAQMLMAGIFLAACFISLSVGTSVGTIVALVPIASGVAATTGNDVAMMTAVVVGGALFGDNLSFISDTTVVATQTQGCRMSDKFRANLIVVAPAAILVFILYIVLGMEMQSPQEVLEIEYIEVFPYIAVLVMAAIGVNVMVVLTVGIMLTGVIGVGDGSYDFWGWMQSMSDGILGMAELIIVTMLAGGMLGIVKENGGMEIIIRRITKLADSRRGGEAAIACLVVLIDFCTANNTVAIITVGPIAKQISDKFKIDPRRSASILDTFSCFAQGIIPYGAQLLMASGLAAINPVEIVPHLYYPFVLFVSATIAIITGRPRRFTKSI